MKRLRNKKSVKGIAAIVLFASFIALTVFSGRADAATVWAWGYNSSGQLGDGTTTDRTTPVQVSGLTNITAIAGGDYHTIALRNDGTVWAWGDNGFGQLGDGTTTDRTTPVQASGLTNVTAIAAGALHTIALKNDGTVWAWGDNGSGRLGDGTTMNKSTPVQASGLTNVTAIAAGDYYSIALKNDGTVWAWGDNGFGQLGDGTTTDKYTPAQVSGLTNITAVAGGAYHTIALKNDGTVWAWGFNFYGQLGDGTTTDRTTPVQVSGLTNITAIAAGYYHTIALKNDGTVWAWGDNGYGQLGDGTTTDRTTPVQVSGLTNITAIAGGGVHTIALKNDGTVWAWGGNYYGHLGDGTLTDKSTPVQVSALTNVTAIASGGAHTIALKAATFILEGNVLRVGVSNSGGLIDDNFTVGIDYDKNGTATWTTYDFLKPGSPFEFYSIGVDGSWNDAGYSSGNAFGATTTNTSSGSALAAVTTGSFNGLDGTQVLTFLKDSGVIDFTITFTNSTGTAMTNLVYARGLDPDQDSYAVGGGSDTTNDIPLPNLVTASAPTTNWTIGIKDVSGGGVPSVDSSWSSNPYSLLTQSPQNDGNGDYTINMAWQRASLAPGESWVIKFQYIIDDTKAGVVDPLTITTPNLPSGDVGKPYSTMLAATGGMPPYTWSDDGNLPPGLYLNPATGELYGTLPGTTNPLTFVVTVTDSVANIASATFEYTDPPSGSGFMAAGGCFIATAAYGSYLHPHVKSLRDFRDRYLVTNLPGRLFVKAYYALSPPIAGYIRASETRMAVVRFALFPVVYGVEHPGMGLAGMGLVLVTALFIGFRRKQ